jgi:hypothetical protein
LTTPIETLLSQATFRCTCCGELADFNAAAGTVVGDCKCRASYVDACPVRGGCVEHCKCPDCRLARRYGLHRINYTGLHHFYFAGGEKTLCNRKLPGEHPGIVRAPVRTVRGDECRRCRAALARREDLPHFLVVNAA